MRYVALNLDGNSFYEKCIALIKAICLPESKTTPHITLRLFKEDDERIFDIVNRDITYLNVIEPGSFNLFNNECFVIKDYSLKSCVVYLKCESNQLEGIDYRPDYPFSRLHITLYEGDDFEFAKQLIDLLKKHEWNLMLRFNPPKHLTEKALGTKSTILNFDVEALLDYINVIREDISHNSLSSVEKINAISKLLAYMDSYRQDNNLSYVESLYCDNNVKIDCNGLPLSNHFFNYSKTIDSGFLIRDEGFSLNEKSIYYVTPPEYADEMAFCVLEYYNKDSNIYFGDSAIGSGALFLALKRRIDSNDDYINTNKPMIWSAIGVDIDKNMALEAFLRCSKRGLNVVYGDALSPDINLWEKRNVMMVNPPYDRHEDIEPSYKEKLSELAIKQTGIKVSKKAGLYVYHLLIMDKWLAPNGLAVWLLPSSFFQTAYGKAVIQYLTEKVQLIHVHQYDEEVTQFDKAMVTTTIVVFKNDFPNMDYKVTFSYGNTVRKPKYTNQYPLKYVKMIPNWTQLFNSSINNSIANANLKDSICFSDLFVIKRGIATGANSFFVLEREKANRIGIPQIALRPILPKARFLTSSIIYADNDGFPKVNSQLVLIDCNLSEEKIKEKYPSFYEYLQKAKVSDSNGKSIVNRTLIKSRDPWYKQEEREPPLFLLTYMGRKKDNNTYFSFYLNKSKAVALNTYIMLYPKPWLNKMLRDNHELELQLFESLKKTSESILSVTGRVYSGGLRKIEPNELNDARIIELPTEVYEQFLEQRVRS